MKVKLLKRLRRQGRNQVNIYSVTTTDSIVTAMTIGFSDREYKGLFNFGDTAEEVLKKAETVYIKKYIKVKRLTQSK